MKTMFSSLCLCGMAIFVGLRVPEHAAGSNAPAAAMARESAGDPPTIPRRVHSIPISRFFPRYGHAQGRSRHPIADLMMVGWPDDQALIMNALIWRAKSLGADGVQCCCRRAVCGNSGIRAFWPGGTAVQFSKAEAFVWPYHIAFASVARDRAAGTGSNLGHTAADKSAVPAPDVSTPPPPASVPAPK